MDSIITIKSLRRSYTVEFINGLSNLKSRLLDDEFWFIIDSNVYNLYKIFLDEFIEEQRIIVQPEEASKSYEGVIPVIQTLIENGFKRNNSLVAIGGGITQDITSFISSVLYRGINWLFVPTNLLSQGDSCIGSKTSINFKGYKNQIGGFYPPDKIFICEDFLETLSESELNSGLGEMAHYFLIDGQTSFEFFKNNFNAALESSKNLVPIIRESLKIKKAMIEIDEFDEGPRNIFNYGHSFGHALEGYTNYSIPHGIAVAFGMDIANAVSVEYGFMKEDERYEMREVLSNVWQGIDFPIIDLDKYINILRKDKKNVGGDLRLILSKGLGNMFIHRMQVEETFIKTLQGCFEDFLKR